MKKVILLCVGLLFLASFARAQVLFNFNKGNVNGVEKSTDSDGGGSNPITGPGLDSLYWANDPSNHANGVCAVALHWDSTGQHGRLDLGSAGNAVYYPGGTAKFITFWVYLDSAQHIPDSLQIDAYAMDNTNWSWTEDIHFARDIPHNVWYPLTFQLAAHKAQNPNFQYDNPADGKGFMTGLQFFPHNSSAVGWHGIIYVDNISLVGALPHYIAGPNGVGGYEKSGDSDGGGTNPITGPGLDSVFAVADPANSARQVAGMALHWDSTGQHGRMDLGSGGNATYFAGGASQFLTFWVYLDTAQHIPDSLQIDAYAMDNTNWSWTEDIHFARDIPHNVWYPLTFQLAAHKAQNPNFQYDNPADGKGFMTGLQFFPHDSSSVGWHGVIYVGGAFLSDTIVSVPLPVWTAANFENAAGNGQQGFYVPSYASGKLSNIWDQNTSNGSNVLQAAVNFSQTPHEFAAVRDTIPMQDAADSVAISISFQIYLPSKMPTGGFVQFFVSGGAGDSVAAVDTIGSATMRPGQWNTISITHLDSLANAGKFNPAKPAQIGIVVWYSGDTATWAGNLLFDNLTVTGIWFPNQIVTGVKEINVVKVFKLYNNYPNPFNPSTIIQYDVPKTSNVLIRVYDVLGREVATLVNGRQIAGSYRFDLNMSKYASGVYFLRMDAGSYVKTQKMMLLK